MKALKDAFEVAGDVALAVFVVVFGLIAGAALIALPFIAMGAGLAGAVKVFMWGLGL